MYENPTQTRGEIGGRHCVTCSCFDFCVINSSTNHSLAELDTWPCRNTTPWRGTLATDSMNIRYDSRFLAQQYNRSAEAKCMQIHVFDKVNKNKVLCKACAIPPPLSFETLLQVLFRLISLISYDHVSAPDAKNSLLSVTTS